MTSTLLYNIKYETNNDLYQAYDIEKLWQICLVGQFLPTIAISTVLLEHSCSGLPPLVYGQLPTTTN